MTFSYEFKLKALTGFVLSLSRCTGASAATAQCPCHPIPGPLRGEPVQCLCAPIGAEGWKHEKFGACATEAPLVRTKFEYCTRSPVGAEDRGA
jgi:hypothetical protein